MPFIDTSIAGLKIFEPNVWGDDRGYFYESYNENTFKEAGIDTKFVQDNQAKSVFGVLRGLHYQVPPFAQAKLVRVIEGEVLDVVVDIREGSATYGQTFSVLLSAENKKQLFIPQGFAHGYVVLSETAEFFYKCDNFYSKAHEGSVLYNDPKLQIDWKIDLEKAILSEKDEINSLFGEHRKS
jgi:dTDP-4-dehydrorhamnose 3,5-epimerase